MNSPIAGVTPAELTEVPWKIVWPTIAATALGRLVGRLSAIRLGWGEFFTLGKLLAVATLPLSLLVYFWQLTPYGCRRYMLTNRRIIIRKGLMAVDQRLDRLRGVRHDRHPRSCPVRSGCMRATWCSAAAASRCSAWPAFPGRRPCGTCA